MSLLSALTSVILPVLAIAGAGFLLGRTQDVQVDALGTITIYVLSPALVFTSLATTTLSGSAIAKLGIGVVAYTAGMVVLAEITGRVLGESESLRGPLALTSTFPNAGNYGIPISAFAFGAVGRSTAVLYIAAQSILMYTLGAYIASRGTAEGSLDAARKVLTLPLIYAVLAAGIARYFSLVPPTDSAIMRTLTLTGNAAIPVMLLMLGIQLATTSYGAALSRVRIPTALKMAVAPLVGVGLALGLGFADSGVARTFVLECAMPAAITPLVLTIEFGGTRGDADITPAEYVSTAIMLTTLVSIPVIAILLAVLESGAIL